MFSNAAAARNAHLKTDRTLSAAFTLHMLCFHQINAMQSKGRTIKFSPHQIKLGRMNGRSTVTDGQPIKAYQSPPVAPVRKITLKWTRAMKKSVILKKNDIYVPKKADRNSTSNISTHTKKKDWTFKATLSPDAVKTSKQAVSQGKALSIPPSIIINKRDLVSKS